jgi:hypothetical protein
VHATVPKHSVNPKCIPSPFIPGAPRETSVQDVMRPQSFQDSMTTDQPTEQTVGASVMTRGGTGVGARWRKRNPRQLHVHYIFFSLSVKRHTDLIGVQGRMEQN